MDTSPHPQDDAPPRTLRPLSAVLAAQAVAWSGTRLSAIALPWFVVTTTGSATQTGAVVFAQMAPHVVAQVLTSPLIDRLGARPVSILGDLVATAAMITIPVLYVADALPLWGLMALVAVVGAADGPANIAKTVFIPAATRVANVPLERGTGLSSALERTASTVGPALAGVTVAAVGGIYALAITAAFFSLGAVIIAVFRPTHVPERSTDTYVGQLRAGVHGLFRDRLLRTLTLTITVTNLLDIAIASVLLPVWVHTHGHDASVYGLVMAVMSATSIGASLVAAGAGHRIPRRAAYVIGMVVGGVPRFLVLAVGAPLWVVLAVHAVVGFGSGFVNPVAGAVVFERSPQGMLGRIRGVLTAVAWAGMPFGGLAAGGAIAAMGLSGTLLLFGGVYLVAALVPGLVRDWRAPHPPPGRSPAR
ncbi:MFS transporter [Spiractinospora alimapuensis]|uniref:MFS transporter n=1 Tax=Spiractinospora alimapuensis TaxID=2820884 RepID=UPI001F2323C7|nr:MFS transporter [Spiractinospora alimapuensis]QVQ52833.1 MFS transporter [Spiractinospora alimapuensis]